MMQYKLYGAILCLFFSVVVFYILRQVLLKSAFFVFNNYATLFCCEASKMSREISPKFPFVSGWVDKDRIFILKRT